MRISTHTRPAIGSIALTAVGASLASVLLAPGVADAAVSRRLTYGGHAYGSTVAVGSVAQSDYTAYVPLCTPRTGRSDADRTGALNVPDLGTIGAVHTKVSSARRGATSSAIATTKTGATSLLGGLVSAESITTVATQSHRGTHYPVSGDTTFVGLRIAGRSITQHPAVGKTYRVPGIGSVQLNAHSSHRSGGQHSMTVTALRLTVNRSNTAGLGAGSVLIGRSVASVSAPTQRRAYGSAYGSTVQLGSLAESGRTAPIYLPCGGSHGRTMTNRTGAASRPGELGTGDVTSSGRSYEQGGRTTATTRNRVDDVNLLSGVVTAQSITTQSTVTRGKHVARSAAGTQVLGLKINGTPVAAPTSSTGRSIPGVGTLYVAYQRRTSTGLQVYGLRLVLTAAQGGLAKGTVLTVGSALAGVRA